MPGLLPVALVGLLGALLLGVILRGALRQQRVQALERANQLAKEHEARAQALFDGAPDPHFLLEPEGGRITDCNHAAELMLGSAREELLGRTMVVLSPPFQASGLSSAEEATTRLKETLERGRHGFEWQHRRKDGSLFWVHAALVAVQLAGRPAILVSWRDITARKEVEQNLRESEERFSKAFHRSPLPKVISTLADGVVQEANEAFLRLTGFTRQEVLGRSAGELGMGADPGLRRSMAVELLAGGEVGERPFTLRTKGGQAREVLVWASLYEVGGRPQLYSVLVDVTERKQVEAALRRGEDRYWQTIEMTGTGYVVLDAQGRVLDANQVYLRMVGAGSLEAIRGRSVLEWTAPEAQAANAAAVTRAAREGAIHDFETVYLRPDGSRLGLSINAMLEQSPEGPRLVSLCRDISGRMRLEAELRQLVERLQRSNAELEQFAFVASHDLQEPLRKILAFGEVLREDLTAAGALSEPVEASVNRMQGGARRMNTLINNLLDYSRVATRGVPFQATDLGAAVEASAETFRDRLAEAGARLEVGPLPRVEADPNQMVQLFDNLLGNAFKYRRRDVPLEVRVSGEVVDGQCRLEVRDNGIGFEPQYAERIFGIFQRLHGRQEYEGTGIGLAICRKIAERHRGTLVAEGRPGAGATFILTLPLTQPGGGAVAGQGPEAAGATAGA